MYQTILLKQMGFDVLLLVYNIYHVTTHGHDMLLNVPLV